MRFPRDIGVFACRCVIENEQPVLFVSHAGGDWQMYCHDSNHDFGDEQARARDIVVVHVEHLLARDPTLNTIADLPIDMGAERRTVGEAWRYFEDRDEA